MSSDSILMGVWACRRRDKMVSHLSFLLLLSLSSLASKVSLSFLAYIFLNVCFTCWRKGEGEWREGEERERKDPVLLCLKHCCGCGGSGCSRTCQWVLLFLFYTHHFMDFLVWRQNCEEPTMDSSHVVGQLDFAFGNAAKDSVEKMLLKWQACGGICNSCPYEEFQKMGEGLFSSSSLFLEEIWGRGEMLWRNRGRRKLHLTFQKKSLYSIIPQLLSLWILKRLKLCKFSSSGREILSFSCICGVHQFCLHMQDWGTHNILNFPVFSDMLSTELLNSSLLLYLWKYIKILKSLHLRKRT